MSARVIFVSTVIGIATGAVAHQGVQNPAVMARMHGMSQIAENMKLLGDMAKGTKPFDLESARKAAEAIARHSADAPKLFRAEEDDPKSEALPLIWDNFDDFTGKALALERIARSLSTSIADPEDLQPALADLGASCRACHKIYRE